MFPLCMQVNLPQFQKLIMEFEKQNELMDMKTEMITDAIDDAMGASDDEEETDQVLGQVSKLFLLCFTL